jgi:hypothetical protein
MAFMCLDKLKFEKWYNAFARINVRRDYYFEIIKYEDGDKHWRNTNGELTTQINDNDYRVRYRNIGASGMPNWRYANIKLSRDGNQLIIKKENHDMYWHNVNGKLHRGNDLPAIEHVNGNKEWYVNGIRHRDNGLPSIINSDGNKIWFVNGKRHRLGGLPAMEYANGIKIWYINGKNYTYEKVINYYKILTRFGRYCLKKIRMRRLRRLRWIHGELLCMPVKGSYPGGQDYHKMVSYFMSM